MTLANFKLSLKFGYTLQLL